MTDVAVLVVHGIGWYANGKKGAFIDEWVTRLMDPKNSCALLEGALRDRLRGVAHKTKLAFWGEKVQPVQDQFEARYKGLRWDGARHVAVSALGDAAQYQAAIYADGVQTFPTYEAIHTVVAKALAELAAECGPKAPLVVVAHSLGAHIASNHLYDEQAAAKGAKRPSRGKTPLERGETLRGFVTLGCNIPLFVMGTAAPKPIELGRARWENYYDPDDVLAFPLKPLYFPHDLENDYPLRDFSVEVGRGLVNGALGRTPASHGFYWDDPTVVDGIAKLIREASAG